MTNSEHTPGTTAAIAALPRTLEVWQAVTLDLKTYEGVELAFDGGAWLTVCVGDGGVVVVHAHADADEAVDLILKGCIAPLAGRARRPARIDVDDDALATSLRARLAGTDIEVRAIRNAKLARARADALLEDVTDARQVGTLAAAGVPAATGRALFDAARVFHRTRPWRVLSDAVGVELELPGHDPLTALVLGAAGETYGLALVADPEDWRRLQSDDPATAAAVHSLSVTFSHRSEVPAALVAEAAAERWPTAGATAFPIALVTTGVDASPRLPDAAEAGRLVLALRAVSAFCDRHRRALRNGEIVTGAEAVGAASGETMIVRLRVIEGLFTEAPPAEADAFDDDEVPVDRSGDGDGPAAVDDGAPIDDAEAARVHAAGVAAAGRRGGELPELDRIRSLTLEVKGGRAMVNRLRWSFFLAPDAWHVGDGDYDIAVYRFLDWAVFAAPIPPDGKSLAHRAIDRAATLGGAERDRLRAIAQPRYDLYDVLQVAPGIGFTVRGSSGDALFVRERPASRQVRRGGTVLGALFPDGDGLFVMSGACSVYPPTDPAKRPSAQGAADLGPALAAVVEQQLYDASHEWIQEIESPAELRRAYEGFEATLRATGTTLPGLAQLQRRVRELESPIELAREAVADIAWWTEMELGVFMAFLQRLWNLTPRPDSGAAPSGHAPSRPPRGTRKRRR